MEHVNIPKEVLLHHVAKYLPFTTLYHFGPEYRELYLDYSLKQLSASFSIAVINNNIPLLRYLLDETKLIHKQGQPTFDLMSCLMYKILDGKFYHLVVEVLKIFPKYVLKTMKYRDEELWHEFRKLLVEDPNTLKRAIDKSGKYLLAKHKHKKDLLIFLQKVLEVYGKIPRNLYDNVWREIAFIDKDSMSIALMNQDNLKLIQFLIRHVPT